MMPKGPTPLLGGGHAHCYRCIWCNNSYKTNAALKGHHSRGVPGPLGCKCKPKSKAGTLAKGAAKRPSGRRVQKHFGHVCMGGTELGGVLCFTYLGSNFGAGGDCEQGAKIIMAITKSTEGVPLVSCHRMLEPRSSCHFFSSIFLFGQSDFQVSKTIFDSREIIFLELLLLFWSSCWVLAYGGGSSVRRPLSQPLASWWGSGGLGGSPRSKS